MQGRIKAEMMRGLQEVGDEERGKNHKKANQQVSNHDEYINHFRRVSVLIPTPRLWARMPPELGDSFGQWLQLRLTYDSTPSPSQLLWSRCFDGAATHSW